MKQKLLFTLVLWLSLVGSSWAQSNALHFDGTDDYVDLPNFTTSYNFSQGFTFSAWVKWDALTGNARLFEIGNGSSSVYYSIILRINGSGVLVLQSTTSTENKEIATDAAVVTTGTWYYVTATISNSGIATIYIDGVLVKSGPVYIPGIVDRTKNWLGKSAWDSDKKFSGSMDEVSIWTKTLTQTEIKSAMTNGLTGSETNLTAYYKFNQGIANGSNTDITTLTDATSHALNGTLTNFALTGTTSNWSDGYTFEPTITYTSPSYTGDFTMSAVTTDNSTIYADKGDGNLTAYSTTTAVPTIAVASYTAGNTVKMYNGSISTLSLPTNMSITSLDVSKATALTSLSCANNKLSFQTLPQPKISYTTYVYAPQQQLAATCSNYVVDLSSQLTAIDKNGNTQTTVYTWYVTNSSTALVKGVDYDGKDGKFYFIKQPASTVYCTMANAAFPDFTGSNILRTADITVNAMGTPIFTFASASYTGNFTMAVATTDNSTIYVDKGDGELKAYPTTSDYSLINVFTYAAGNTVKIYGGNISGISLPINISITALDVSKATALTTLVCPYNKLSFQTLPQPKTTYTTYIFTPQQQLTATCTGGIVDLSSQLTAIGADGNTQTTEYTWYDQNNNKLSKGVDYKEGNGVFFFMKQPNSMVYCTMTNDAFSNFTLRTVDITIDAIAPINWTGATDTDWNTATNWDGGVVPTADNNVVIPKVTNLPVISTSTSADCKSLTVNDVANLTIASSAAGTGSLIVHGTSTGKVTAQSYLTANQWHIIAPAAEGGNISSFITSADNAIATSGGSTYGMADYNEASNSWNQYFTVDNVGANTFTAGKGYEVLRSSDGIVSFTGTLTTGNKTVSLVKGGSGWNCVGNPYTSAININASADNNAFLHYNAGAIDSNYGAIYLWDPSSSQYKVICNSGAGFSNGQFSQNHIAPGQGFFVKAASDGATVTFTRDMQSHQSSGNAPLRAKKMAWPSIRLNVVNNNKTTSTVVAFNESMTKGLDPTYDAGLLRGTSGLNLYTRLVDDNGVDFAVQCLPEEYNNLVIPLGVESKNGGDVTFDAETVSLPSTCNVILEDKATNTFTSLANGGKYTATVTANASGTGRFYLHTSTLSTLPAGTATNSDNAVNAYAVGKVIYINSKLTNAEVSLYDISGKSIHADKLTSDGTFTLNESNLSDGVYLLRVISSGKTYGFKLVLKN